ncbi:MAG TPA: HEAT repeat domain-containing protein [Planctomycetota bacterium]|nr:HEAT repeat domain-containing protein [Planctomycetota bacterium]
MKIYFCDICNTSIPLQDLDAGTAVAVKGKLLCANCNAAAAAATKGGPAAAATARAGGVTIGRAAALAALAAVVGIGAAWIFDRRAAQERKDALAVVEEHGDALSRDVRRIDSSLGGEVRGLGARVDELRDEVQRSGEAENGRREHDRGEMDARFAKVFGYVEENERQKQQIEQHEIRLAASSESLGALARAIDELKARVDAGATASAAREPMPAAATEEPPASAPAAPGGLPALPAGLQKVAEGLKSSEAEKRWDAVGELARPPFNKDVIPYLLPMLKDPDDFVRHHAAEALGDLDARAAIPALIDSLSDPQQFVREMVNTQLRRITRQTFKFDPSGKKDDRDRQQRQWRTWWEQNREKLGMGE